jgi:sugar phosphate isomerase/epimerase
MKHAVLLSVLLCGAALTAVAKENKVGLGPSFKGPLGVQLYSLRDEFKKDVPGTVAKVRGWGISYVELAGTYGLPPEKFHQVLLANQLTPIAAHFPYDHFKTNLAAIVQECKALGLKYAGVAWIPHQDAFDEAECREAIDVFNKAGVYLHEFGIRFFYHIHGYEFQPHQNGTLLDLMMKGTLKKYVAFEMDVFWVHFPAQDPVELLKKYGKRWELMHIKDMKKGVVTGALTGKSDPANDVALGQGQIDFRSLLGAAHKAGVKWYFIEDESPRVLEQVPVTLRYLEEVTW